MKEAEGRPEGDAWKIVTVAQLPMLDGPTMLARYASDQGVEWLDGQDIPPHVDRDRHRTRVSAGNIMASDRRRPITRLPHKVLGRLPRRGARATAAGRRLHAHPDASHCTPALG